jgi:hypothetical protein
LLGRPRRNPSGKLLKNNITAKLLEMIRIANVDAAYCGANGTNTILVAGVKHFEVY